MQYDDFKITISDFENKIIQINSVSWDLHIQMPFDHFKDFSSYIYASYKKYDYVLKRGEKNGIKNNTP